MSKVVAIAFVFGLALGCDEGGPYTGALDLSTQISGDLAQAPSADLSKVDLLGPDCGTLVKCSLGCLAGGLGGLGGGGGTGGSTGGTSTDPITCLTMCGGGAQPAALQEAGALVLCAAQNCLSGLTGGDAGTGGGTLGALQCVAQACPSQVAACPGLLSL